MPESQETNFANFPILSRTEVQLVVSRVERRGSTSAVICVRTPGEESPGTAATSSQVAALPTRRPAAPLFSEAEILRLSATYLQHQCVDSEC